MNFLIDENLPWPIVDKLIEQGHEVHFVSQIALGMSDSAILNQAGPQQIIVTEDKDFGELVFRRRLTTQGVLLVRLPGMSMARRAQLVADKVADYGQRLAGSFTVISHGGVRRQALPPVQEKHQQDTP